MSGMLMMTRSTQDAVSRARVRSGTWSDAWSVAVEPPGPKRDRTTLHATRMPKAIAEMTRAATISGIGTRFIISRLTRRFSIAEASARSSYRSSYVVLQDWGHGLV